MENNISIYIDIFKEIRLKSDSQKLSEQVDAFLVSLFKVKDKSNEEVLREIFGEKLANIILTTLNDKLGTNIASGQYQLYFNNLSKVLNEAKVIELTLSIEADKDLVINMSNRLREILALPTLLIDLKLNTSIIGGAEMIFNGKYINLSLEKNINDLFTKQ